ncbi:TIGR03621 family F420-dependent LLM class oxidoreductase [Emcibacter sp. SYSU 3D8]|uniref:TIGR03621 family F420-dependent LLM class oxidoreductase n=1 Tax=Emcibacter sp. SYSU 3D8 TaxID=3133969 RepID=UPI0031FED54F
MAHKKPFRFSWQAFNATSASQWRDKARRAEALGYSTFHVADHYIGPGPALAATNHPVQDIAAVPALAMAAEATSTINIGARVFCTGYRPAPVLIKEAMTLDFLSDGRFELGLGAGWIRNEYEAMGIPFPSAGTRIKRLEETIRLAKAAMRGEMLQITGEHVRAVDYEALPLPPRGKVPLIVGGGAPRVLGVAGREADIVSINFNNHTGTIGPESLANSTAAETRKKIGWVRDGAGGRFDDIEIEIGMIFVALDDSQRAAAETWARMFNIGLDDLTDCPHALIGSVDSVCDDLHRLREEFGISYINVQDQYGEAFAPVVARLTGK